MHRFIAIALALGVIRATLFTFAAPAGGQPATPATAEIEANKALVRRYFEIAGGGDLDTLSEVVSPDLVIRTAPPGEGSTLQSLAQTLAAARTGLPDFAFRIDDLFAAGDMVVVRTTISGTHLGDFFGAPPTGKRIETTAIDLWRVTDGKLTENWHFEDILGVMRQLGTVPGGIATPADTNVTASLDATTAASDAATLKTNVALVQQFHEEIFEQGNLDVADEILAPEFIWHNDVAPGAEGVKKFAAATREGIPDLTLTADQVIAEGDRVAILWSLSGTHQGEFLGAPATGNQISTQGIDIYRIADGKIAEIWTVGDALGLLIQLGALPQFSGDAASTSIEDDQLGTSQDDSAAEAAIRSIPEQIETAWAAGDGWFKDSRVVAEAEIVRFLSDDVALIQPLGGILMPGETEVTSEARGMQTFVATNEHGEWLVAAYQNTRIQSRQ